MKKLIFISLFTIALADCEDPNQTEYFITCDGGSYQNEISWNLNPIGLDGGAPYSEYICLSDNDYELRMFDSYGDGWNGNLWSIYKGDFDGDLVAECSLGGAYQDWGQCFFALGDIIEETCAEMNGNQCISNSDCEWIEDINNYSCSGFSQNQCYQYEGCDWTLSYGGSYGSWSHTCSGSYQIDNSYCEEIEVLECSEMNQLGCVNDSSCEWVENIDTGSCSSLSVQGYYTECDLPEYGSCYSECTNWGSYYGGMFCYGTMYCTGGNYQTDNSYCEENEYLLGDTNSDFIINILDIIIIVDIILNEESNDLADINNDGLVNIIDIVQLVDIILNN